MKLRLSKKKSIIISSIFFVVLAGSGGYLLWRVNDMNTLSEQLSHASEEYTILSTDPITGKSVVKDNSTGETVTLAYKDYYTATGMDQNCAEDEVGYKCGDGLCCIKTTSSSSTSSGSVCGNGSCESGETLSSCSADCSVCGDNSCTGAETLATCPADCSTCGDNSCTGSETLAICPGDCSVCGDNQCTGSETTATCSSDCLCKDLTWTNKPDGEYPTNQTFSGVSVTNINSKSTSATGVEVTLNSANVPVCSTGVATCYTLSNNTSGYQVVSITIFSGVTKIDEGTYLLSLVLPVDTGSCASTSVSTSATFTIKADAVVVVNEEVPATGLFDGVMSKIYLGAGFVFLGIMTTQFSKFGYVLNTLGERNKVILAEKKRKREENKRNRFERRFK